MLSGQQNNQNHNKRNDAACGDVKPVPPAPVFPVLELAGTHADYYGKQASNRTVPYTHLQQKDTEHKPGKKNNCTCANVFRTVTFLHPSENRFYKLFHNNTLK